MKTVYLHIGIMKTGSSSLQEALQKNRRVLEKKGYGLPDLYYNFGYFARARNAFFMVWDIENPDNKKREELQKKAYAELDKALKKHDTIILTEEELWHRTEADENFWKKLREHFDKRGCRVKVVVYLRRQDDLVESLWNQWVKQFHKETRTFQEWMQDGAYKYYPLDYYAHLEKISSYMGKENILVRVYDSAIFKKGKNGILDDFLNAVGLSLTDEYVKQEWSRNNSLSGNLLEIKRWVNRLPEYRDDFLAVPFIFAGNFVNTLDPADKSSVFSYDERISFLKLYEESNRKVAEEYLGKENGILFEDPVKNLPAWKWNEKNSARDMFFVLLEEICTLRETVQRLIKENNSQKAVIKQQSKKIEDLEGQMKVMQKQVISMYNSLIFRVYRKIRKILKKKEY